MISEIIFIAISMVALWLGARWLVDSASRIARLLGVSDLVIGLTVVALGTSAPEFAVTILAALRGYSNISVGNIVGSNIFNLGFILGGVAIVHQLQITPKLVYRDGFFLLSMSGLLLFFFRDLTLGRIEGAVLFMFLMLYLGYLFWRREPREMAETEETPAVKGSWKDVPILILGFTLVLGGSYLLVDSASSLARAVGISEWVIGVTIVAAGTSAPEFVTSLVASLKGRHSIAAGNLIGSDIFNLVGVLGLAGMLRPLQIDPSATGSLYMLLGMIIIVILFMRTGWKLTKAEGVFLVLLGAIRWIMDFS